MNQYWSARRPVLVTNRYSYWSHIEAVLVGVVTSTGWFFTLVKP